MTEKQRRICWDAVASFVALVIMMLAAFAFRGVADQVVGETRAIFQVASLACALLGVAAFVRLCGDFIDLIVEIVS